MSKLGLALSGGGFRATLYHLGVVRYLKDVGELPNVTHVASVSGGSILAAHLVLNWDRYTGDDDSFDQAASEIVRFAQFDVRNHIVRRLPLLLPARLLGKLHLWRGRALTANAILQRYYENRLYGDRCLYELPEQPMLHILATNVSNGNLSVFNREGLYIQQRGADDKPKFRHVPGQLASLPQVVCASSAFPGFFPPVRLTAADLGVRDGQFPTEYFTDGGVYDNLGMRAFAWLKLREFEFGQVLVSDAGKPFQILSDSSLGFIGQSVRASDILWDRVWQLEREGIGQREGFLFLPITEAVEPSEDPTASHQVVQAEVQTIRTDLDRFSDKEINALVQHGYAVARKICRREGIIHDDADSASPAWKPIADEEREPANSSRGRSRGPSVATQTSRTLRRSSRRRILSTLLDMRDWPTYVYLTVAFLLFVWAPLQVYQLYKKSQMQAAIIDSIASGDPDIRLILGLVDSDPMDDWVPARVSHKPTATEIDHSGIEVMTHSRIYDLRHWQPDEQSSERLGYVYVRDRMTLKLLDTYEGDGDVVFRFPSRVADVEFRQPNEQFQAKISKVDGFIEDFGQKRTLYELEYDLSVVPIGDPVTLEIEMRGRFPKTVRVPFVTRFETNLISAWMLFPADRPYRTYSLVSYPLDRRHAPRVMNARYTIDHPYGSLIGWSVVNPGVDMVYECRWTTD